MSKVSDRRIAALAEVDPKTIRRWNRGQPIRPRARSRIQRALESLPTELLEQAKKPEGP